MDFVLNNDGFLCTKIEGVGCILRWPGNPIVKEKCIYPDCGSNTHCSNNPGGNLPCTVEICETYDIQGEGDTAHNQTQKHTPQRYHVQLYA